MIDLAALVWGLDGRPLGGPLDCHWPGGCCVALRGPNGGGKTTLLRTLAGVLPSISGSLTICGHDLTRHGVLARRCLGWAADRIPVPGSTQVGELLELVCWAKGLPASTLSGDDLSAFAIEPLLRKPLGTCSLGEQRRCSFVAALLGDPPVLLLDEPDHGLDTAMLGLVIARLNARAAAGRLNVFSTHDDQLIASTSATVLRVGG